jgi:hypothetical protein
MNRRLFIQSLTASLVAMGLPAPPPALEQWLPEQVTGSLLIPSEPQLFRICFPDGTVFSYQGIITACVSDDENVSISVRPIGEVSQFHDPTVVRPLDSETVIIAEGGKPATLLDIGPPAFTEEPNDDAYTLGLRRHADMKIRVRFDE